MTATAYTSHVGEVRETQLLEFLERMTFDVYSGCWYPPDGTTDYIGRAVFMLWHDKMPFGWERSLICDTFEGRACVNPTHVRQVSDFPVPLAA